jgi:hypothetical protein
MGLHADDGNARYYHKIHPEEMRKGIVFTCSFMFALTGGVMLLPVSCTKDEPASSAPAPRELQVWLHRVNSIEKAQYFLASFTGYELDVRYNSDSGTYFVKHDAEVPDTLRLTRWLAGFSHPEGLSYWLDFKNLEPGIARAALDELLRIRNHYGLERMIVVESGSAESLVVFDTLNFFPSCYIPTFVPSGITPEQEIQYRDFISSAVETWGLRTISGYSMQLPFMQEWFPSLHKLSWYLDSTDPVVQDSVISEVKKDTTVYVLLITKDFMKEGAIPGKYGSGEH